MSIRSKTITERFRKAALVLNAIVISLAALSLIEVGFNLNIFRSFIYPGVSITPILAVFCIMFSIALTLKNKEGRKYNTFANVLCFIIIALCLIKVIALIFHLNIYPERVILKEAYLKHQQTLSENLKRGKNYLILPMVHVVLIASAIIFIDYETKNKIRPVQFICFLSILISLILLYAWLYKIKIILEIIAFSILGAGILYLLTLSILFSRADKGFMKSLVGEYSAENISLRIIALVVPLVLGWLKLEGVNLKLYSKETGTAIFSIIAFFISIAFLARNAALKEKARQLKIKAGRAIKTREERLKAVLDNISEGVVVADAKGEVLFSNQVYEKIFQKVDWLASDKKIANVEYGIFEADGKTRFPDNNLPIHKAIKGESVNNFELIVKNQEFSEGIILKVNACPIKDSRGKVVEGVAIFRNITYRKQLETLAKEEEKRLRTILNSIGEGVIVADTEGKFIIYNSKATELTGMGPKDVNIKDRPREYGIYHSDQKTIFQATELPLYRALKGEPTEEVELFIKNEFVKEGRKLKETTSTVYDEAGNIIAAVIVMREIA